MDTKTKDIKTFAIYPFIKDAREYVKNNKITVEEILHDIAYEKVRMFAIERLENAFYRRNVGDRRLVSDADKLAEILSYPIARMVAVCIGDNYFIKRYALGEAVRAYYHLRNESPKFLECIGKDMGLSVKTDGKQISLFFIDYIKYAPTKYREWKMVNRPLRKGFVQLSPRDFSRILQEVIRLKINEELKDRKCNEIVADVFKVEIERFKNLTQLNRKKIEAQPVGKISVTKLPPCMKNILSAIQAGENVPHMGRFAFVAFLSSLGLKREDIVQLFSTAPDYDEERTRYQIDHITGRISSTKYAPPGCEKMKTYGLCPTDKIDDICKRIKNPVSYYKLRVKMEKNK